MFFLSYSRQDAEFANKLRRDLEKRGFSVWLDEQRLAGGEQWVESLSNAIASCSALILVVSPDATKSNWVMRETAYALRCSKVIVPLIHRSTSLPPNFEFMIGEVQWIDFSVGERAQNLSQLISSLKPLQVAGSPAISPAAVVGVQLPSEVYIEDVEEFFHVIPRRLILKLWKAAEREVRHQANHSPERRARMKSTLREMRLAKYLNVIIMRPPPTYAVALAASIVDLLFFVNIAESVSTRGDFPVGAIWSQLLTTPLFYLVSISFIGGVTLGYALCIRWLRKTLDFEEWANGYKWCPHRPLQTTENVLLVNWPRVRPIIWNMLEVPVSEWRKYADTKIRDPALRRVVELTAITIMNSPEVMRRPRTNKSGRRSSPKPEAH